MSSKMTESSIVIGVCQIRFLLYLSSLKVCMCSASGNLEHHVRVMQPLNGRGPSGVGGGDTMAYVQHK